MYVVYYSCKWSIRLEIYKSVTKECWAELNVLSPKSNLLISYFSLSPGLASVWSRYEKGLPPDHIEVEDDAPVFKIEQNLL